MILASALLLLARSPRTRVIAKLARVSQCAIPEPGITLPYLAVARAGTRVNEIGRAIEGEVRRHGFNVVRGLSGHGVGRTIHEEPSVPNDYDPFQKDVLTKGLVVTIEPMISAGSVEPVEDRDGWTIRTRDGSLAAHHEHTIMITRSQPLILTAA